MSTQYTQGRAEALHRRVQRQLLEFTDYKGEITSLYTKIYKADIHGEISSINEHFYQSLLPELQARLNLSPAIIRSLDAANLFTWIAFTLYDEIADEHATHYDAAQPRLLASRP